MNDDAVREVIGMALCDSHGCDYDPRDSSQVIFHSDIAAIRAALRAAGYLRTPGTVEVKPGLLSVLRDAAAYAVRNYPPNGEPEQEPTDTWQSAIFVADAALAAGADDGEGT